MKIGSVLAFVDGGKGSEKVMRTAIAVGNFFSAYVEILHIERPAGPDIPVVSEGGGVIAAAEIFEALQREETDRSKSAENLFQELFVDAGLTVVDAGAVVETGASSGSFAWNLVSGHDNRELAYRGRLFDLIIMAKAEEQDGGVDSAGLEAALFDTGRPVLIASDMVIDLSGAQVAIAWDGSREAARSVGLALPFIEAAGRVSVLSVGEEDEAKGAEDLSRYLARHGVKNECRSLKNNCGSIAGRLIKETRDHQVGLLIMGAYGHSAFKEYLFGGVTREMLETGELPLLLAH